MRKAKSKAMMAAAAAAAAAKKTAAAASAKAAAKPTAKAAAKGAAKLASAVLKRVDDGIYGIQSLLSSSLLLLMTAGYAVATQLQPPDQ